MTLFYLILFFGSVAAIFLAARLGDGQFPSQLSHIYTPKQDTPAPLFSTLSSLLVIIIATRFIGGAFKLLGQPRVIGEIIGGIMLGPSLFGMIAPNAAKLILPAEAFPYLSMLAQIGVLLFMFLLGLELDLSSLRRTGRAAVLISHASIVLPFLFGMGFALAVYSRLAPPQVAFSSFALFIGTALSVTAFPVLARILADSDLHKTPLGVLALTCAAIDDATAWCLLAVIVGILQSAIGGAFFTIAWTGVYVAAMFFIMRPLLLRLIPWLEKSSEKISEASLALVMIALLISALSTELIGIHALFGGFLLGVIIPHESLTAKDLSARMGDLVQVFFLPAFFAFTGMRTQIGLLEGAADAWVCAALIAVAVAGKFGGAFLAAKFSGLTTRSAAVLGVLMNTRGLVGLIVLNVGLDLGVLTPRLFTMLVVMAVVTTVMTGPLLKLLYRPEEQDSGAKILLFHERN